MPKTCVGLPFGLLDLPLLMFHWTLMCFFLEIIGIEIDRYPLCRCLFPKYAKAMAWAKPILGSWSSIWICIWVTGIQILDPALLPSRRCISIKTGSGVEPELKVGLLIWDADIPCDILTPTPKIGLSDEFVNIILKSWL